MVGPGLAVLGALAGGLLVSAGWQGGRPWLRWVGLVSLGLAALRLLVWESYPDLWGGSMAPWWGRAAGYLAAMGGAVWAAAAWQRHGGARRVWWGLLGGAYLLGFWWVTFEATLAIDAAHHGRLAGDEGLLVAGVWALYGLLVALVERWLSHLYLRHAARLALGAALIFLVLGAVLSNARWADPGYRLFSYVAVFGSTWAAEALFAHHGSDGDVQGQASLTAAVGGLVAAAFELRLWLDRAVFTFDTGMVRTQAHLQWETAVRANAAVAVWALWALGLAVAGYLLKSWRCRMLAAGILAAALGYAGIVTFTPGAPPALRLTAVGLVAIGALVGSWLSRRTDGEHHRWEAQAYRWLTRAAALGLMLFGVVSALV